jgi:hypothetical protein
VAKVPSAPTEPLQRRIFVPAAKRAAVLLWGEDGLNDIAQKLHDDTREEFFKIVGTEEWIPARHVIHWCYVAHHGPCGMSVPKMREYIDRVFDFSYGVVRRSVLRMADPVAITPRVGPMWKEEHTAGELEGAVEAGGKSALFRLVGSPFTETPHTRAGIAESYRYAYALTRAKNVTETHALEKPGVLTFRIRWA